MRTDKNKVRRRGQALTFNLSRIAFSTAQVRLDADMPSSPLPLLPHHVCRERPGLPRPASGGDGGRCQAAGREGTRCTPWPATTTVPFLGPGQARRTSFAPAIHEHTAEVDVRARLHVVLQVRVEVQKPPLLLSGWFEFILPPGPGPTAC
jgi:hypothetical protein